MPTYVDTLYNSKNVKTTQEQVELHVSLTGQSLPTPDGPA